MQGAGRHPDSVSGVEAAGSSSAWQESSLLTMNTAFPYPTVVISADE
jgi:hypothetical protein